MVAAKQNNKRQSKGKAANNRKVIKPVVTVTAASSKSKAIKNRKQNKNNQNRRRNTTNNNKNTNNRFKIVNAIKTFQIPPPTTSAASGFIDFNEPCLMQMQNVSFANQKSAREKNNRFSFRKQQLQQIPNQPEPNIKPRPILKRNNKNNNSGVRFNTNVKNQRRSLNQISGIQLPPRSPYRNFQKMVPPPLPLRPMHGPPLVPHLPARRFGPVGPQIRSFAPSRPILPGPMMRGGPIPPMRPPLRSPGPMLRSSGLLNSGLIPIPAPLPLIPHCPSMSRNIIPRGSNLNQISKNLKRLQNSNNNLINGKIRKNQSVSNKKTLKEILNQFPLDKPWVNDAIKTEAKIKENIENRLKGNKNDQLFAEFKIQRDKFVAMYEEAKKEFHSKINKDNKKKEKIESDKVKMTK